MEKNPAREREKKEEEATGRKKEIKYEGERESLFNKLKE
jgi:hypothetical protein